MVFVNRYACVGQRAVFDVLLDRSSSYMEVEFLEPPIPCQFC